MKKNEVTVKCKMESGAVANLLSDLVTSFREGKVVISKGVSFVTLRPTGQIEVEMEAVEKKGKQRIEIQLSWRETTISEHTEDEILRISGDESCLEETDAAAENTQRDNILFRKW